MLDVLIFEVFEYSCGGDLFLAASHGETRLVFDESVDEDGEAGGTVIVLAGSAEDLDESHFVKATDAFDFSRIPGVNQLSANNKWTGDEPFLGMKVTSPELAHNFLQVSFEEHRSLKRFGFVSSEM